MQVVPHSKPTLEADDESAVLRVLRSGHIAQGAQVTAFENAVAHWVGRSGGVATSSGTAALHLALLALEVQPGDLVALPSYVCTAPLYAVQYVGATPLLIDIDPVTYNIDVADLQRKLTARTKAIIVRICSACRRPWTTSWPWGFRSSKTAPRPWGRRIVADR